MIRNMTLCLFVLTLTFSSLFAEWATTPMVGIQLTNDPDHYEYIKAYCQDGEGGYYVCIENEGRLYINHIDLYGNIRWPIDYPPEECFTDQDPGWLYAGPKRETVVMACNSEGIVWVAWSDFRDSYFDEEYWPTSSDIYIQKFDQNRVAQWNPETALLVQENVNTSASPYVNDHRGVGHLEPQYDGSIIVLWGDGSHPSISYTGNHWAQRFDTDGDPLWETPGIRMIPNSEFTSAPIFTYSSDGIGGVLFTYLNKVLRLLPTGELAWAFGDVEIDRIVRPRDVCKGYDNTIVVIGDGRRDMNELDYCFATVIDTSGNLVHGPTSIGDPEHDVTGFIIGQCDSEYGLLSYFNRDFCYYRINDSLELGFEHTIIDSAPRISAQSKQMSNYGYRVLSKNCIGGFQMTHNEVWGYDVDGNWVFTHALDEDPQNVEKAIFDVDESGNTWVFWMKLAPHRDLYVNIIGPDGEWGLPSNSINNPQERQTLPTDISLSVYPNPGNGQFNVSFDLVDPSPATFIVTNVLGQRIWYQSLHDQSSLRFAMANKTSRGTLSLNLNDQASGTYFIQVRTESGLLQQKRILLVK